MCASTKSALACARVQQRSIPVGTESPRMASTAAWEKPRVVPIMATATQNSTYLRSVCRNHRSRGLCCASTHHTMLTMPTAGTPWLSAWMTLCNCPASTGACCQIWAPGRLQKARAWIEWHESSVTWIYIAAQLPSRYLVSIMQGNSHKACTMKRCKAAHTSRNDSSPAQNGVSSVLVCEPASCKAQRGSHAKLS